MKFERLRLTGFKSFCDNAEFRIEPGLTGVVGPNGCGKSNLVEALRWVMGESSFKNMRGSGMEDVIFAGSGRRPSRNNAEVGLVLDNSDRRAPAAFNDSERIEVTRRIERDQGSTYRVNGKEVRARDVQLLFADASTGARSPSLVRQGQIGEIISAKPQARRLILEEAAGVSGLHSRRHEAELRLKGAEDNLTRLEDVLQQIDAQVDSLKRQARQSNRYRELAGAIRRHEALAKLIAWREHEAAFADARRRLDAGLIEVAERTRAQGEAARAQAIAAAALPALREEEARRGAALHRIALAREALDAEEKRAKEREAELDRRIAQFAGDLQREEALIADAAGVMDRFAAEDAALAEQEARADDAAQAREAEESASRRLASAEAALAEAQAAASDRAARQRALTTAVEEEGRRLTRLEAEYSGIERERSALGAAGFEDEERERRALAIAELAEALAGAEREALAAEQRHAEARETEARHRGPLAEAERAAQRLETEARTVAGLLGSDASGPWPRAVDAVSVARGYEAALGAALGDDLDAAIDEAAPAHWSLIDGLKRRSLLPAGAEPLAMRVSAPPALARRLAQVGVVARADGKRLARALKPGQRLVSLEGDLWRWDGFVSAAEAPTAAARRLKEKNRLGDLEREAEAARQIVVGLSAEAASAASAVSEAAAQEAEWRGRARAARSASDAARDAFAQFERARAQTLSRLSAVEEAFSRAGAARNEAAERKANAEAALDELGPGEPVGQALDEAREAAARERAAFAEARAAAQSIARETQARAARRGAIAAERSSWSERLAHAQSRIAELAERKAQAEQERATLDDAPTDFARARRALADEHGQAEAARKEAADALALGRDCAGRRRPRRPPGARSDERRPRAARRFRGASRRGARAGARSFATRSQPSSTASRPGSPRSPITRRIWPLPGGVEVERKLENLRQERERLGAVNLRADDELVEVLGARDKLVAERDDLTEAIKRLRGAIGTLNQEGRERLVAAFDVVNGHFRDLFSTLFEGGNAELQLIESDDPLEAGLELLAQPPGKKPQTLTLLSGGEQALTALALIFAVFLTNPAPICVLDEVDAPLDDYNVERFCDLLEAMRKRADTRFVAITHNPVTMARMDRLFGVTMAEKGVSQLVSVELAQAQEFAEAG